MDNLTQNYTYEDEDLDDSSLAQPCHATYCLRFGGSIPALLATASILGLICNLLLSIALVWCPRLWDRPCPSRTNLFLISAAGLLFAATLPFFAVAAGYRWIFGGPFCQAARGLKYGCLFAQSLVVASATCHVRGAFAKNAFALVLFVVGFVCAVPVALSSSTDNVCAPSLKPELLPWSLAHTSFCLVVLVLLPVGMFLAKAALKWHGKNPGPPMDTTWLFYLFWAPYGVAQLLDKLRQEKALLGTCPFQESLDHFLGLSEGLGTSHCFLCPLLILWSSACP